jgi:hypothetical protein
VALFQRSVAAAAGEARIGHGAVALRNLGSEVFEKAAMSVADLHRDIAGSIASSGASPALGETCAAAAPFGLARVLAIGGAVSSNRKVASPAVRDRSTMAPC